MVTNHPSHDVLVSAEEADRARQIIPAMKRQAKETGVAAGGKAGLKNEKAKAARKVWGT
jgi:hypothetical protein